MRCLLNVRFGALCGLKSDICRGPRSADTVAEVCGYSSEAGASISRNGSHYPLFADAHHAGEFLAPSIAGAFADKAALKKSRRSGTKVAFNAEVTRQRNH
jgi:hypothetical protein